MYIELKSCKLKLLGKLVVQKRQHFINLWHWIDGFYFNFQCGEKILKILKIKNFEYDSSKLPRSEKFT